MFESECIFKVMERREESGSWDDPQRIVILAAELLGVLGFLGGIVLWHNMVVVFVAFIIVGIAMFADYARKKKLVQPVAVSAKVVREDGKLNVYKAKQGEDGSWDVLGEHLVDACFMTEDRVEFKFDEGNGNTRGIVVVVEKDGKPALRAFLEDAGVAA